MDFKFLQQYDLVTRTWFTSSQLLENHQIVDLRLQINLCTQLLQSTNEINVSPKERERSGSQKEETVDGMTTVF